MIDLINKDLRMQDHRLVLERASLYIWRSGTKPDCQPLGHQELVFWRPAATMMTRSNMVLCLACPDFSSADLGHLCEPTGPLAGIEQLPVKDATKGGAAMLDMSRSNIAESNVNMACDQDSIQEKRTERGEVRAHDRSACAADLIAH